MNLNHEDEINMSISVPSGAHLLAAWLADNGMTRLRLAYRLLVDPSAISHWVNGNTRPTIANALKLQLVTGIPCDAWVDDELVRESLGGAHV